MIRNTFPTTESGEYFQIKGILSLLLLLTLYLNKYLNSYKFVFYVKHHHITHISNNVHKTENTIKSFKYYNLLNRCKAILNKNEKKSKTFLA